MTPGMVFDHPGP